MEHKNNNQKAKTILLHACCGPCSLEPVRLLRERGIEPVIFFSNSNIAPKKEYDLRRDSIKLWCEKNKVEFIEDEYLPKTWVEACKSLIKQKPHRCRQCYKIRFERACAYAKENGFECVGTTLTISPYQYALTIKEELTKACEKFGIMPFYEDYSTYYRSAQKRAKEEGLYRQHYCGCLPSKTEAESQQLRQKLLKEKRAKKREEMLQEKRKAKAEYAEKRAKQKEILKSLRNHAHANK